MAVTKPVGGAPPVTSVVTRGGLRWVARLLVLAVVGGCDGAATELANAPSRSDTAGTTSPATPAATARSPAETPSQLDKPADYRVSDLEAALRSVAAELADVPLTPRFATGSFVACEADESDTFLDATLGYTAQARLDYFVGQAGSEADAEELVAKLETAGWQPRNDDWATGGIHRVPGNDRWTLYLTRDGLSLRVDMHVDVPVVLVSLSGPCAATPAEEAHRLRLRSAQELKLPGAVPLEDAPVRTTDGQLLPPRQP